MFIKLTEVNFESNVYVAIDKISYLYFEEDEEHTKVKLNDDNRLHVQERPEEIIGLINRAKFSEMLDQEIVKPAKKKVSK